MILVACLKKAGRGRKSYHVYIFVNTMKYPGTLNNSIYHSSKQEPPPFFYSNTITSQRSRPFCWQNPCSGFNSGTGLVLVLEYGFFQFRSNTDQIP